MVQDGLLRELNAADNRLEERDADEDRGTSWSTSRPEAQNQYPVAITGDMSDINSSSYSESWNRKAILIILERLRPS